METQEITTTPVFRIESEGSVFFVTRDGVRLTNAHGITRYFLTRNTARKRISRERRGDFHR